MGSPDSICDGNSEDFPVGLIEDVTLGLFDSTMLGFANASKLEEEIGCKEGTSLSVFDVNIEGITEATMFGVIEGFRYCS